MADYEEWLEKEVLTKKWLNNWTKKRIGSEDAFRRAMLAKERDLSGARFDRGNVIELAPGTFRGSWHCPPMVIEAAKKALDEGYTETMSASGFQEFRDAIAEKAMRENGIEANPNTEIQGTHGVSFTFNMVMRCFIEPGDDILMIDPDYYLRRVPDFGANVVPVPLKEPSDHRSEWFFDVEELIERVTPKSKMLVFANGNNPTGHLYTKKELEQIAEVVQEKDLLVFSDELYSRCVFDGKKHYSIAALPGMKERTITASSFSKIEMMSGFRIGYAIANKEIRRILNMMTSYETECLNTIGQKAAIKALSKECLEWIQKNTMPEIQRRRDYAWEKLNKIEDVTCAKTRGTYYLYPNISKYGIGNPNDIIDYFVKEAGVLVRTNYGPINSLGHFRVSACAAFHRLAIGLDRIKEALEKFKK